MNIFNRNIVSNAKEIINYFLYRYGVKITDQQVSDVIKTSNAKTPEEVAATLIIPNIQLIEDFRCGKLIAFARENHRTGKLNSDLFWTIIEELDPKYKNWIITTHDEKIKDGE